MIRLALKNFPQVKSSEFLSNVSYQQNRWAKLLYYFKVHVQSEGIVSCSSHLPRLILIQRVFPLIDLAKSSQLGKLLNCCTPEYEPQLEHLHILGPAERLLKRVGSIRPIIIKNFFILSPFYLVNDYN